MKTQKSNGKGPYLQTRNNRWKWMAGATAATAAGVTASQASLITVNLTNNYISGLGGNHLNADLTGDGHPDLTISRPNALNFTYTHYGASNYIFVQARAQAYLNGVRVDAFLAEWSGFHTVHIGSQTSRYGHLTGSIPIFFKDLHINGGAPTKGSLEVTVGITTAEDAKIQLDSFTYNSTTAGQRGNSVPDQGSGLALLAMGAGGILAFRRWRATQERS